MPTVGKSTQPPSRKESAFWSRLFDQLPLELWTFIGSWLIMVLMLPFTEGVAYMALPFMAKVGIATGWAVALSFSVSCAAALVVYGLASLALKYIPKNWKKTIEIFYAARYSALVIPLLWMVLMFSAPLLAWPVILGLSCLLPVAAMVFRGVSLLLSSAAKQVDVVVVGKKPQAVKNQYEEVRRQLRAGHNLDSALLNGLNDSQRFALLTTAVQRGHPKIVEAITQTAKYKEAEPKVVIQRCFDAIGCHRDAGHAPLKLYVSIVRILLDSRDDVTVNSIDDDITGKPTMLKFAKGFKLMETFLTERAVGNAADEKASTTPASVPAVPPVSPPRGFNLDQARRGGYMPPPVVPLHDDYATDAKNNGFGF